MSSFNVKRIVIVIIAILLGIFFMTPIGQRLDFLIKKESINLDLSEDIKDNASMDLTSDSFENEQKIPSQYTCDGENVNPPLSIGGVPEETESLALTVTDPDAPAGTWTHWVIFNMPLDTDEIDEDSTPQDALHGVNDFGNMKWGGPCPPSGEHRYVFKAYALDTMLDLPAGANREALESAMEGHILDQAELVGKYSRT